MRRKKLLEFATWLAKRRSRFDMVDSGRCIAANALKWAGVDSEHRQAASYDLMRMFDIDGNAANDLYFGATSQIPWSDIPRMDAVRALRNVAAGKAKIWEC